MKYRKITLILSLLVMFSFILSACASPTQAPAATAAVEEPAPAEVEEPTTAPAPEEPPAETADKAKVVMFVGLGTGTDPDQVTGQEQLVEEFNSTHEDIELELLIVPHEEAYERYLAMVAGGDPPEILTATGFATLGGFLDSIEDLAPYMEAESFDTSDFYGPVVDIMADFFPGEGQPAMPLGFYPAMIFYNKDMFDAAGLDYPTHDYEDDSWNMDMLREYAIKMTLDENGNDASSADFDPEKIKQWGFDDSWADSRNYLATWGAPGVGMITTPDYKTAIINQEEWVVGDQWLSDGIWEDHFIPDLAGQQVYGSVGGGDPFGSNMVAMFYSHTWFFPEGLTDLPFEYDIAPVPNAPNGAKIARSDVDGIAITKGSDQKEAAWEVVKWLTSSEKIVDVCLIYGCLPPRKSVEQQMRDVMLERWPALDYNVVYDAFNYLDNPHSDCWAPEQRRAYELMEYSASLIYSGENKDAKAVLDEANAAYQKVLDEYWASQDSQ